MGPSVVVLVARLKLDDSNLSISGATGEFTDGSQATFPDVDLLHAFQ